MATLGQLAKTFTTTVIIPGAACVGVYKYYANARDNRQALISFEREEECKREAQRTALKQNIEAKKALWREQCPGGNCDKLRSTYKAFHDRRDKELEEALQKKKEARQKKKQEVIDAKARLHDILSNDLMTYYQEKSTDLDTTITFNLLCDYISDSTSQIVRIPCPTGYTAEDQKQLILSVIQDHPFVVVNDRKYEIWVKLVPPPEDMVNELRK